MTDIDIKHFPAYFRAYNWVNVNHQARGYPGDTYPEFPWIKSLEDRGLWLAQQAEVSKAPTDYIREILSWGSGTNDPRMRFETGLGNVCLLELIQRVILHLNDPEKAIDAALKLPGCGLTYASKLLRFLNPNIHGSLDKRIREAMLKAGLLKAITDGNNPSMVRGYVKFQQICLDLVGQLEAAGIARPVCNLTKGQTETGWRVGDVEMALFAWTYQILAKPDPKV